jgi:hypothetical protein
MVQWFENTDQSKWDVVTKHLAQNGGNLWIGNPPKDEEARGFTFKTGAWWAGFKDSNGMR